jgi:hypothetical protein
MKRNNVLRSTDGRRTDDPAIDLKHAFGAFVALPLQRDAFVERKLRFLDRMQ